MCDHYYGKVFAHVAAAIGIAGGSAASFHVLDRLMTTKVPFLVFFVDVAILLGLLGGIYWSSPGSLVAYLFFIAFAAWIGQTIQSVVQTLESKQKLTRILALTAGVFVGMMAIGFYDNQNTLGFAPYFLAALTGLVLAHLILYFFYSSVNESWLSSIGVALFALLTVYDTQVIKQNKQVCNVLLKRGHYPHYPKESIGLFLDFVNLFANMARQN